MTRHIVAIALLSLAAALPAGGAGHVEYQSPGFCLTVTPEGVLQDIRADSVTLIQRAFLFGSYPADTTRRDTRFFQGSGTTRATITQPVPGTMLVSLNDAILGNGEHQQGIKYRQRITVTPYRIDVAMEVETLVPMASNYWIFNSLHQVSLHFAGHGFRYGQDGLGVVPAEYDKGASIPSTTNLAFSGEKGVLSFIAGPDTDIVTMDARAWGGDHLDMRIFPKTQWQTAQVPYPAGSKFKWSYAIEYKPHPR